MSTRGCANITTKTTAPKPTTAAVSTTGSNQPKAGPAPRSAMERGLGASSTRYDTRPVSTSATAMYKNPTAPNEPSMHIALGIAGVLSERGNGIEPQIRDEHDGSCAHDTAPAEVSEALIGRHEWSPVLHMGVHAS